MAAHNLSLNFFGWTFNRTIEVPVEKIVAVIEENFKITNTITTPSGQVIQELNLTAKGLTESIQKRLSVE